MTAKSGSVDGSKNGLPNKLFGKLFGKLIGLSLVLIGLVSLTNTNAHAAGDLTEIEVEPKSTMRTVGHMNEMVTVTQGAGELGKAEFKVSCGVGVAYAFIPGEENPYRFSEQKACAQILATQSAVSKCRSTLRLDSKMKSVEVLQTRCGLGGPLAAPRVEPIGVRGNLNQGTAR